MADNARYSIYDEKGDIVMVFVGKDNIIENSMKFGRLTVLGYQKTPSYIEYSSESGCA